MDDSAASPVPAASGTAAASAGAPDPAPQANVVGAPQPAGVDAESREPAAGDEVVGPESAAVGSVSASASASAAAQPAVTPNPTPTAATAPAPTSHHGLKSHEHPASPAALRVPHIVAPSSYLRFNKATSAMSAQTSGAAGAGASVAAAASTPADGHHSHPPSPLDRDQQQGIRAIRDFLKVRTSYDVLPLSFRLIVLDTGLLIKKSLNILTQNSIVSAPLWDSDTSRFAGILTATDYINVIQYYYQFPDEISKLDQFRLSSLRDIEKAIGAIPIETTVLSVITQYRILKFIAVNNEQNTVMLKKCVRDINLGTYTNLATARMDSTVLDAIHLMVEHNISCIPIVDADNKVLNAFEAVDVIPCIKGGAYEELDGSIGEALCKRPDESPGIYTCGEGDRLDSIFDTVRKSRVHRLIVVDDDNRLRGVISLSDILKYVLLEGEEDAGPHA
ncbi:hypothetical protein ACCO45_007495 [Purpureocillium lilacinum]|uniref:Uncharacterized protein n=1 Tax=Purpureocillium lilacinum TaxID=33203 RepID=A0ACC4DVK9_PURLI